MKCGELNSVSSELLLHYKSGRILIFNCDHC